MLHQKKLQPQVAAPTMEMKIGFWSHDSFIEQSYIYIFLNEQYWKVILEFGLAWPWQGWCLIFLSMPTLILYIFRVGVKCLKSFFIFITPWGIDWTDFCLFCFQWLSWGRELYPTSSLLDIRRLTWLSWQKCMIAWLD